MTKEGFFIEFGMLRQRLAKAIKSTLAEDPYCKSYEGTWELLVGYPSYFDDKTGTAQPEFYRISLHCYVLGPYRHYDWDGRSWGEAFEQCKAQVEEWIKPYEEDADAI